MRVRAGCSCWSGGPEQEGCIGSTTVDCCDLAASTSAIDTRTAFQIPRTLSTHSELGAHLASQLPPGGDCVVLVASSGTESYPPVSRTLHEKVLYIEALRRGFAAAGEREGKCWEMRAQHLGKFWHTYRAGLVYSGSAALAVMTNVHCLFRPLPAPRPARRYHQHDAAGEAARVHAAARLGAAAGAGLHEAVPRALHGGRPHRPPAAARASGGCARVCAMAGALGHHTALPRLCAPSHPARPNEHSISCLACRPS